MWGSIEEWGSNNVDTVLYDLAARLLGRLDYVVWRIASGNDKILEISIKETQTRRTKLVYYFKFRFTLKIEFAFMCIFKTEY